MKVAITGGIGSGKSVVCRIFSVLGIPVYNADMEAKNLSNTDPEIRKQYISIAGENVYQGNELNRRYLAELIFNDKVMLRKINQVMHPRLAAHFSNWLKMYASQPYTVFESAILIQGQMVRMFDQIVAVIAPDDIRIVRVLSRDNMTLPAITNIMKNQPSQDEIVEMSNHVITNDDQTLILPQVLKLHRLFTDTK